MEASACTLSPRRANPGRGAGAAVTAGYLCLHMQLVRLKVCVCVCVCVRVCVYAQAVRPKDEGNACVGYSLDFTE